MHSFTVMVGLWCLMRDWILSALPGEEEQDAEKQDLAICPSALRPD